MTQNTTKTSPSSPLSNDTIFRRLGSDLPFVIHRDGKLFLTFGGGTDANHQIRTFTVPIVKAHLSVIENDFVRHSLLAVALFPLGVDAGTDGPINIPKAALLCNEILLGSEREVEALFQEIDWDDAYLIAHHADVKLLAEGKIFAATQSLTLEYDMKLAQALQANRERARRGVILSALDAAVLKYTGQYYHRSGVPKRTPSEVDPELLPQVLEIISTAEKAAKGMDLPEDWYAIDHSDAKSAWKRMSEEIETVLHREYPTLEHDVVESVGFLMCNDSATRLRAKNKKK